MEAVLCFESPDDGLPKVIRDYRARYRAISQVPDEKPETPEVRVSEQRHAQTMTVERAATIRSGITCRLSTAGAGAELRAAESPPFFLRWMTFIRPSFAA